MFVYDFPLTAKARTYLKFEAIFNRIQESAALQTNADTFNLLRGIIDFLDLLDVIDKQKDLAYVCLRFPFNRQSPNLS